MDSKAIEKAIEAFWKNGLVLKIMESLKDYLSYKAMLSSDKKRDWL